MKYTVVDLFAGVGGLSYGFSHNENFDIVLANEIDVETAKAYELNHPNVKMLNCDIKILSKEMISKVIDLPVDIVVGGPPCQSFSTLGKRANDDQAQLFREYCRVLKILQPKLFIFENVKGLLSVQGGNLFDTMQKEFENIGYALKCEVLNSVEYGVPQIRERVILVGTKNANSFRFPRPTHGKGRIPLTSMSDAIGDLPIMRSGECNSKYRIEPQNDFQRFVRKGDRLVDNCSPKNGEHLIRIMEALPDGGSKNDLPENLKPKSGYGNTYAKLWWDKPVTTITRNFSCVSSSRCIHPRDSRALTTREGARLQSFPDSYLFYGSVSKKNLQIGNAVPPLLSIQLAKSVLEYMEGIYVY
ncbi:MAG: DNA cytosine methyltransferase [Oscillospiraceae bacterium]|nr:DNA cytosine methyltransferase [Oscillospiraceae bacterium]